MMKQIFSLIVTCLLVVNLAHSNSELSGSESIIKEGQSKDLEIFLLIGQSNMAGRATIEDQDRDSLQRVFLFTASDSREWEKAANPLNRYSSIRKDLKMQRLGPGYSFAKKIAESFPEKQFGLVVNAKGGTTLDEWLPGTHFYNEAVKRVRMAMEYGNLRGVVWHQGEGDINKTETYIERIRQLIESLRRDTGIPDLPFVAGQLSEDRPARIPFNEMIMHLPEKVRYTGVASSEGTSTFDDTHFDSKSQRLLGERYATEMVKLLSGKLSLTLNADDQNSSSNNDVSSQTFQHVKANFQNPERASGVNCWWWWLNGNVNKAAITKDLEAMKSRNFQGAMVFDAGGHNQRGNNDIPAGPLFGSDEWNELFVFALDEAKRVGLEIGFNIQSGWNLGGPRVTPEYTAKQITYSEIKISGNKNVSVKLDLPKTRKDFYRDIAVLAFTISDKQKTNAVITDLDLKLGYRELGASAPDTRFLLTNSSEDSQKSEDNSGYMVTKEDILDISSEMDANGNLNWKAPEGEWIILRIGYTCTDSHVSTSSGDWQGSVLDYMSKEVFDFYWNDVVEPIFKAAGDHVGTTLKYMETDSWECGGMNWTDKFAEEFQQYRGYDLKNYLPIVAGYVVDDIETSNAFLADFRKTLGDLVAYNHYAVFQEYAHKYNMGVQPESAGPHAGPLDGIKNYGFSDVVMSEFWSPSPHRPNPENRFFLKQASSAAHIYGKKIVGAESFTTIGPHWNDELWHDQKSSFDHEICAGLNRMYFHTFTSSPPEMGLPGQEYFAGTHVNPQVTWWKQSGAFIDYMHRTQSVVQEGKFIADVLYYYGDHVPNVFPYKHSDPAGVMPGFDYDVTDETIFLQLKVEDGKLLVPGGVKYRILVLPDHKVLSMAVLEKVEELLNKGVTVLGPKPVKQVSLVGGATAQKRFGELVDKIWGDEIANRGEKDFGKGKVAWGMTAKEYLLSIDVPADFDIPGNDSKTDFDYIHYTVGESDVYFVSNQTTERQIIDARFRVSGKQPELWDALTGNIREAKAYSQKDGLTTVPLTLEPYGAIMVVFNTIISDSKQGEATRNYNDYKTLTEINGAWSVYFDPAWGGPGSVTFPELMDWSQHSDEGVKYYSGTAVYNKTFHIDFEPQKDKKYFLQLGSVKDVGIAEVKINGKDKGVVWTSPFRVEISDELKKGENTLEIKVVNSWYNRVAGDQTFPDKKQYTSTNIDLKRNYRGRPIDEIPLESTGLLGPVAILEAKKEEKKVSIGLIGDSTVADEYGWGPAFSKRFSNNAHVINFAKNGATLQSLSGRLDELLKINPDYVLIQFGHNDQKRYDTDVYSEYLKSYIERVQKAGGIPVVVSSVVRRTFDENGKIISQLVINENYTFKANLEAYAHAAQTVARELKVPFIDLYTRSIEHHNKIGPEESMTYNFEENDKTHFSSKGAEAISDLIIKEIKIVLPRLTEYLK